MFQSARIAGVLIPTFIGVTQVSYAEEINPVREPVEEVTVWGTRVSASSVLMGEADIAIRQADHLSDLLRTIPGIDVGGAHSLNQRVTIRSMDDKDLRITIDGANQNTYMYHHMGNLQIHADILQSVDVSIGTNSVIDGGLGGAVRFETKSAEQLLKPDQRFGARIQGGVASNSGQNWSATGYGKLAKAVDFLIYHNQVDRDNYDVGGGEIIDNQGEVVANTDGTVRGLEGRVTDTLLKFGWDFSHHQRVEIGYEGYLDKGDYSYRPDMGLATDLAIVTALDAPLLWPTEFARDTLTVNYEGRFGSTTLNAALFDNQSELNRDESGYLTSTAMVRGQPVSAWAAYVDGTADNRGLNILAETTWALQTLTYGIESIRYDTAYRADYHTGALDQSDERAQSTAVFVQDRFQLSPAFAIIPGVRYDQYKLAAVLVEDTFSDVSGALALEFQPSESLLLKLSHTQLFKAPEIGEVFIGAGLFDVANQDIAAESGHNSEFSLAYNANAFAAGFTAFATSIKNYIFDYAPAPEELEVRSWKDNIGTMALDGFETYVGFEKGNFSSLLTYASAESELEAFSEYADLDGARIDRQQGDSISLNIDYDMTHWGLKLHWESLVVDDVAAGLDLDGATLDNVKQRYSVHNISASWSPESISGLTIIGGIDNIADEYYASQSSRTGTSGHPLFGDLFLLDYEPGRNVKMTVSYQF